MRKAMSRWRSTMILLTMAVLSATIIYVTLIAAPLWAYVAGTNFLVALGYLNLVILIWMAPFNISWLRRLGYEGLLLALFLSGFFIGCGAHHAEMCVQIIADNVIGHHHPNLSRLAFWDSLQVICAVGAAIVMMTRGTALVHKLRNPPLTPESGEVRRPPR